MTLAKRLEGSWTPQIRETFAFWPNCTACIASDDGAVEHAFRDPESVALGSA